MAEIRQATKRLDLIEVKLGAIRDKDVDDIVTKETYIPFMGRAGVDRIAGRFTLKPVIRASHIADWLEVRAKVLEDAKMLSVAEIEARIDALSKTLCVKCSELIKPDTDRTVMPCADCYEALCKIWLYQFSLGLT